MEMVFDLDLFKGPVHPDWCPGCGDFGVLKALKDQQKQEEKDSAGKEEGQEEPGTKETEAKQGIQKQEDQASGQKEEDSTQPDSNERREPKG